VAIFSIGANGHFSGERDTVIVPAEFGYGRAGLDTPEIPGKRRLVISPQAMLVYQVEILRNK
jgi:hypothetical protein